MKKCLALCALILSSCAQKEPNLRPALDSINTDALLSGIKVLSSDEFEGRAPGSKGEDLTVDYLTAQFKQIGLKPGNPDGTYIQKVPLAGTNGRRSQRSQLRRERSCQWYPRSDHIIFSHRYEPEVKVKDSPIVFVGYGVVAPEYGWDDYKDVDLKGKTILDVGQRSRRSRSQRPFEAR